MCPPAVIMSMTREPESEEVTKKITTTNMEMKHVIQDSGNCCRNTNKAEEKFS